MKHSASDGIVEKSRMSHTVKPSSSRRMIATRPADFRSTDWYKKAARLFAIPIDRRIKR